MSDDIERDAALARERNPGAEALAKTMPDIINSIQVIAQKLTGKPHGVIVIVWNGDGTAPFATNSDKDSALQVLRDTYSAMKGQMANAGEKRILIPVGANDPSKTS